MTCTYIYVSPLCFANSPPQYARPAGSRGPNTFAFAIRILSRGSAFSEKVQDTWTNARQAGRGKGERGGGEATRKRRRIEGMVVQQVTTGERGVITDISFQRSVRDIKVAWGNHYSDIVRSSLFRESLPPLSLSHPIYIKRDGRLYILLSLSRLAIAVSFYLSLSIAFSAWFRSVFFSLTSLSIRRCLFECVAPFRAREGWKEREREGRLLIRIPRSRRRHLVANPFRSRRISTRTRPRNRGRGLRSNRANFHVDSYLSYLEVFFFPSPLSVSTPLPTLKFYPTDSKMEPRRRFAKRFLMDCT